MIGIIKTVESTLLHTYTDIANGYMVDICQLLAIVAIGTGIIKAMITFLKDVLFGSVQSKRFRKVGWRWGISFR